MSHHLNLAAGPSARWGEPTTQAPRSTQDERALVLRVQAGDASALRELYRRFAPEVHRYAILPVVHDRVHAEDLLADTFVRALENIHRFECRGQGILPWLIRIARNLCFDHLRKAGRVAPWPEGVEHLLRDPGPWNGETVTAHREAGELLRERIEASLCKINPRYRRVLQLRLVHGTPRDRAAQQMGVTMATLDVLLFRACRAFRKVYLRSYGTSPTRDVDVA